MCAFNSLSPTLAACVHGHPPALLCALGQSAASGSGANQERGEFAGGVGEKGVCQSRALCRRGCIKIQLPEYWSAHRSCPAAPRREEGTNPRKRPHRRPWRHVCLRERPLYRYWWKAPAIRREESWKWKSGRKHRAWDVVTQGCCVSDVEPEPW